jgi:hypothetical protein
MSKIARNVSAVPPVQTTATPRAKERATKRFLKWVGARAEELRFTLWADGATIAAPWRPDAKCQTP